MKRGYDRTQRIGELIQKTLAQMLVQDMNDDRFRLVTITGATVARDLSFAKIYVSVLMDDQHEIKQTMTALNHAAKGLRFNLARAVKLRVIPDLKFIYDESTAVGFKITNLINSALKDEKNNNDDH